MQGYVTQEDVLIGTLTVRETIQYSARLRLPDKLSPKELKEIVDSTIVEMGLDDCQNTPVGTFFVRGISGGEKRSSIALHILTRPHLLFLDEPTSGLDRLVNNFPIIYLWKLLRHLTSILKFPHNMSANGSPNHELNYIRIIELSLILCRGRSPLPPGFAKARLRVI